MEWLFGKKTQPLESPGEIDGWEVTIATDFKTPTATASSVAPTPTATPSSVAPTASATPSSVAPTPTATATASSAAPTPTVFSSVAPTPTATATPSSVAPTPTATATPSSVAPTPTATATASSVAPTPTATASSVAPTSTATATASSVAPTPTATATASSVGPTPAMVPITTAVVNAAPISIDEKMRQYFQRIVVAYKTAEALRTEFAICKTTDGDDRRFEPIKNGEPHMDAAVLSFCADAPRPVPMMQTPALGQSVLLNYGGTKWYEGWYFAPYAKDTTLFDRDGCFTDRDGCENKSPLPNSLHIVMFGDTLSLHAIRFEMIASPHPEQKGVKIDKAREHCSPQAKQAYMAWCASICELVNLRATMKRLIMLMSMRLRSGDSLWEPTDVNSASPNGLKLWRRLRILGVRYDVSQSQSAVSLLCREHSKLGLELELKHQTVCYTFDPSHAHRLVAIPCCADIAGDDGSEVAFIKALFAFTRVLFSVPVMIDG